MLLEVSLLEWYADEEVAAMLVETPLLLGEGIPAAPAIEAEFRFPLETFDEDDTDEDDTAVVLMALLSPGVRADGVDGIEPVSPSASAAICADCAINFWRTSRIFSCSIPLVGNICECLVWKAAVAAAAMTEKEKMVISIKDIIFNCFKHRLILYGTNTV